MLLSNPIMASYIKAAQYEPKSPSEHVEGVSYILPLEGRMGYVFVLAHLSKKTPDNETLVQLIGDHIHKLAGSFAKDANIQHRFEQFLGSINETLAQTVREGRFAIPINHFHAIVGIVCDERMFLSGTGELAALFLHKKPSQHYQIFNLFRGIQTEQALPTWEKPFAVVLDGDLEEGDVLCVSQKDLQRFIPQDELNTLLTSLPPKSATEKIRQYFPANDGLLLLILKSESANTAITESYAKPLADVSIDSFVRAQDETEQFMADQKPNIFGFLFTHMKRFWKKSTERSRILQELHRGEPRTVIFFKWFRSLLLQRKKTITHFIKRSFSFFKSIKHPDHRMQAQENLKVKGQKILHTSAQFWEHMSKRTKRVLLTLVLLVILLCVGLWSLSNMRKTSKDQKQFQASVTLIQSTIDKADGAMIYRDENQARALYSQATTLLQELPQNTPEKQEKYLELSNRIDISLNELRHIITIPNPTLLASLAPLNATQPIKTTRLLVRENLLFVFDEEQHMWEIDPKSKQSKLIPIPPNTSAPLKDIALYDSDQFITLDTEGNMTIIDQGDATAIPFTLSTPDQQKAIALTTYSSRLYTLTETANGADANIFKYTKTNTGFSAPSAWITSKTHTLEGAQNFAIDGSLFILQSNGSVTRFQNGSEIGWKIGVVDPPLTSPTRLFTDTNSSFVSILDPGTKRLIIYKKSTGEFVSQYTSDAFSDLTDLHIDEKNQTIYLLAGSNLYTISATHLTTP